MYILYWNPIMDFKALLVLACVAAGSLAGPVRDNFCASQCESNDDGIFRAFKSYYYDYDVTFNSLIDDDHPSGQTSQVRLVATAIIEGLSTCEKVLKLDRVAIERTREDGSAATPEDASELAILLEAHPLRFSMESNGTITSVCPEEGEDLDALNIKRGFLSTIQTRMVRQGEAMGQAGLWETDVTGTCMPSYHSEGREVIKTQDYLVCKDRTRLSMFADAVMVNAFAPTVSPLSSQLQCRYLMDDTGLRSVTCFEEHRLKAFPEDSRQPLTTVQTTVTRRSVTHRIETTLGSVFARQTNLLFEDANSRISASDETVRETLLTLCSNLDGGVTSETPALFGLLTNQLGRLDSDDMSSVISQLFRICPESSARTDVINMVKDALIDCNSEECVQGFLAIMRTENTAVENDVYLKKWFMKLVLIKNPTKDMLHQVHRFVSNMADVDNAAYYALSSMIHEYCTIATDDCSRDGEILEIAAFFENNLDNSCAPETEQETKKMLMSLKAIGNMGLVQSKALMNRCNRNRNPFKVRLASIEAHRRLPCDRVPIDRFMEIFSTVDNDSELRIAAYRGLIRCPSETLLEGIARVMAVEPTNQVSCYVSSHLHNLLNSQDPLQQDLKLSIQESPLVNVTQCDMDIRKFSRNYAFSQYNEESGNGIHVDGDLIFSPRSYLPRTARLGFNIDLFGYGLDLFEVEARTEGMQERFESLLEKDSEERTANMVEHVQRIFKKQASRHRRAGVKASSINKIKAKYDQNHLWTEDSEEASLSLKLMDTEVAYKDQDDFARMAEKFSRENMMTIIASLMQERTREYTVNKNFKPSSASVPTIAGLPLEVSIKGALTSVVKASGSLDVVGMATKPRRMAIFGSLEPSAAVEIQASMMVNTSCIRSGLTHKTNLAASVSVGGSLGFENGMLKLKVDAPTKRQTLIDASSSLYFMEDNALVPVADTEEGVNTIDETFENRQYRIHVDGRRPGFQCSPLEALFHQWKLNITLDKLDQSLMSYDLEVGYHTEKAFRNGEIEKIDQVHILVGAPGSESIGTYSLDLTYHRSNKTVLVHSMSPTTDNYITASLLDDPDRKSAQLTAVVGGDMYGFQAGLDTIPQPTGVRYVPIFNMTLGSFESYALEGSVIKSEGNNALNISLINRERIKLMAISGDLVNTQTMKRVSASASINPFSATLQAGFGKEETSSNSVSITPIFEFSTSLPALHSLRIGGRPVSVSRNPTTGKVSMVTIENMFLATPTSRLFEVNNLHYEGAAGFGFQAMIDETIPVGVEFQTSSQERHHTVDLTATSIMGEYHIGASLDSHPDDPVKVLNVITNINETEFISLTTTLTNQTGAKYSLDTDVTYKTRQLYRLVLGMQQEEISQGKRFTPLFRMRTRTLGSISLAGSVDVAQDSVTFKDLTIKGAKKSLTLTGEAGIERNINRAYWTISVVNPYTNITAEGATSCFEQTVTFNNMLAVGDGTDAVRSYTVVFDLQNSTREGQILSWNSKLELNLPHHPELSFRADSAFTLTPGRSYGDVFRLCYDGIDCTDENKRITLGHDLTFSRDHELHLFNNDLEVQYSHPAAGKSYSLSLTSDCGRDVPSSSSLLIRDDSAVLFNVSLRYVPETKSRNGSVAADLEMPGLCSYGTNTTWRRRGGYLMVLSQLRSGEDKMGALLISNLTVLGLIEEVYYDLLLQCMDSADNTYAYHYSSAQQEGSMLRLQTVKKNNVVKMLRREELTLQRSEESTLLRVSDVWKTMFSTPQEFSYNLTFSRDHTNNNNANLELLLGLSPSLRPYALTVEFRNTSSKSKREGLLRTTVALQSMNVTTLAQGKLEGGVPSGTLSLTISNGRRSDITYSVDLAMRNATSEDQLSYKTSLVLAAPRHQSSIRHYLTVGRPSMMDIASEISGSFSGIEVSTGVSRVVVEDNVESKVYLTLPDHTYELVYDSSANRHRNVTILKDSEPILMQNTTTSVVRSAPNNLVSVRHMQRTNVMGHVLEGDFAVSNLSDGISFSGRLRQNTTDVLDISISISRSPRARNIVLDVRSEYVPGYATVANLIFLNTETVTSLNSSLSVNYQQEFSFVFSNDRSVEDTRITHVLVKQPTNPDLRLRQLALHDSCRKTGSSYRHNTTVMWGDFLPTQMIGVKLVASGSDSKREESVKIINPGRVFGFGNLYGLVMTDDINGYDRSRNMTVYGEMGRLLTIETDYKNASMGSMKNHQLGVTVTRANKEPISVQTSLIHNGEEALLDADLVITYSQDEDEKISTGIEVTERDGGHELILTFQHLINAIDITMHGTYIKEENLLRVVLENSILLGINRYQPEIILSLNKTGIDLSYTDANSYALSFNFVNGTTDAGHMYNLSLRSVYKNRETFHKLLLDQPQRILTVTVHYNPDNTQDVWTFSTGYENNTAVFAKLDTVHKGQLIHNGSIVIGLSNTTILTTHIMWEPSWPEDLKAAVRDMVAQMRSNMDESRQFVMDEWEPLAARIAANRNRFVAANADIVGSAMLLKTQLETQWTLNKPLLLAQVARFPMKFIMFNMTLNEVLVRARNDRIHTFNSLKAQFADIAEYFKRQYPTSAETVKEDWSEFVNNWRTVGASEFASALILSDTEESDRAEMEFYTTFYQQMVDSLKRMRPMRELFAERFAAVRQARIATAERIEAEFTRRIGVLSEEQDLARAVIEHIREDVASSRRNLNETVSSLKQNILRELEAFQRPDVSPFSSMAVELKESLNRGVGEFLVEMTTFVEILIAPYTAVVEMPLRFRRATPDVSSSMDLARIQAALANFNKKYSSVAIVPAQEEITSQSMSSTVENAISTDDRFAGGLNKTLDFLKKVFNGTFELTKFDLENGEIMFRFFLQDWKNMTAVRNLTAPFLDALPRNLSNFNVSALKKLASELNVRGLLSKYQQRFQEQFSSNSTYFREIMERLQTRAHETIETRIRPLLERFEDRALPRSRPFFPSYRTEEVTEQQRSFIEELGRQMDVSSIERMYGRMKQAVCGAYNQISSTISKATCPRKLIPPFKANALVIGAQHYMTFDQQFYDFSGKCGYLLAKDFVHENDFSAIVDYDREAEIPIRNMMFMINTTTFSIKSDGSVLVNRQARELPFQVDDTVVLRLGDAVFLKNAHGVTLGCKLQHDVCFMVLKGRYFARTAGLLGNFNYEQYDDLKTPDNEVQTNITSFADSWKVGKNCLDEVSSDINRVIPQMESAVDFDPLNPDNRECANMFLDNCSPVARCHSTVDPDAFYRMCVTDTVNAAEEDRHAKLCSLVSAYKTQCWMSGSPVKMPDTCITCELGDQTFDASSPQKIEGEAVPRKADFVIVVEEKQCVQSLAENLDNIVMRLAGKLKEDGFEDVRFGLAAFGGAGIHEYPHPHTINHQIFSSIANEFVLGRDSLVFSEESDNNDTFAAISLAANYPFRAGASKNIILLGCSECRKEDTEMEFSDLSVALNRQGISFFMLTDHQFTIRKDLIKSKSKSERVYGMDDTAVYTSKMTGQDVLKGDRTLREFIREPTNLCSLLAQETNGAIFDSSMMDNKGFVDIFVKRIAKESEPKPCQVCRCVEDKMVGVGRSVCEVCTDPANPFQHAIRGSIRDFELRYDLPHMRFSDQIEDEE
ncbi:apolipophorins-like [Diadema setosum]|uniref:apolipophorins-like n=1 Tax=Diadema setosum TaxID=31175 RepID=UPI003B3B313C